MTKLNTKPKNANWARVYNELNPNSSYEIFIEILNSHIDECIQCLSLFDGPEELAFLSHSLKQRDVGFMCCIRDTEHPTIEPHFCVLDVPGQRC